MADWLAYSPRDLLLFSEQTYWRLFELHNTALWPLQLAALAGLIAMAAAALAGWRHAGLAAGIGLACAWVVVAEAFLRLRYEPINWAVAYVLPPFWVQAGLLALFGRRLSFGLLAGLEAKAALVLLALAVLYPLVGLAAGRPWLQAEVAGLAPDPTAVATLGLLGLARPGWHRLILSLIPAAWLILSAGTLLTMNTAIAWVPLAALGLAAAARLARAAAPAS